MIRLKPRARSFINAHLPTRRVFEHFSAVTNRRDPDLQPGDTHREPRSIGLAFQAKVPNQRASADPETEHPLSRGGTFPRLSSDRLHAGNSPPIASVQNALPVEFVELRPVEGAHAHSFRRVSCAQRPDSQEAVGCARCGAPLQIAREPRRVGPPPEEPRHSSAGRGHCPERHAQYFRRKSDCPSRYSCARYTTARRTPSRQQQVFSLLVTSICSPRWLRR